MGSGRVQSRMSCQLITKQYVSIWEFGILLKGSLALLWRCPGYQKLFCVLSLPGLEPATLHFPAQSLTDWPSASTGVIYIWIMMLVLCHGNTALLQSTRPVFFPNYWILAVASLEQLYWLIPHRSVTLSSSPSVMNLCLVWISHYIYSDTFPEHSLNWDAFDPKKIKYPKYLFECGLQVYISSVTVIQ